MNRIFLLFISLMLSGCSILIEKTAKYSDLALDENCTRERVVAVIGEPVSVEKNNPYGDGSSTETYLVKGRVFDSGDFWAAHAGWAMTWGIHELFMFPWECWNVASQAIHPTEKYLEIMYHKNQCAYFRVMKKP